MIVGFFLTTAIASGESNNSSEEIDNNVNNCDSTTEGYKIGYTVGEESEWDTPEEHIRNCNNGHGMVGEVPPCWKEGFRDGHSNEQKRKLEDKECYQCNGRGRYTPKVPSGYYQMEKECGVCNGTGKLK